MIKINISQKNKPTFLTETHKDVYTALNTNKTVLRAQKGADLYNFTKYETNERKGDVVSWNYLLIDFERKKNDITQTEGWNFGLIKKYTFIYYPSYNNGLHLVVPLLETYTEAHYKKNSKKIIDLIKSWKIGKLLDEAQISPRRWLYMPHTKSAGLRIGQNKGELLSLINLSNQKKKHTDEISYLKTELFEKFAGKWHDDKLYPLVQALKNEGVDKTTAELFWQMLKHPDSKSDFENKWSTENSPYTINWIYKILDIPSKRSDLSRIIEKYNVYWDILTNIASVNRIDERWSPEKTTGECLLLFFKTKTSGKVSKQSLATEIAQLQRDKLIDMAQLYKEHIIPFKLNNIEPTIILKLFKNLCDNGNGDIELIKTKLKWLCNWFYVALFFNETHQLPALNFFGIAGAGKTLFSEIFRTIYQNIDAVVPAETKEFNGAWANAKMLLFEESSSKKTDMERIKKQLFATHIQINRKNLPIYSMPNNFLFQFNSNEATGGLQLWNDVGFSRRWSFFKVVKPLNKIYNRAEITEIVEALKNKKMVAEFVGWIKENYEPENNKIDPLHIDLENITKLHKTDLDTALIKLAKGYRAVSHRSLKEIFDVYSNYYQKKYSYRMICAEIFDKHQIIYSLNTGSWRLGIQSGFFFKNEAKHDFTKIDEWEIQSLLDENNFTQN